MENGSKTESIFRRGDGEFEKRRHGGGAEVSLYALEIMKEYEELQLKVQQLIFQEEKLLKILK